MNCDANEDFRSRQHDAHATEQQESFRKLDKTLQDFISKLAQGITHIGDLIAIENAETRGLIRTQHAESKNLIQSEHAKNTHTIMSGLQNLQIQTANNADGQRLLSARVDGKDFPSFRSKDTEGLFKGKNWRGPLGLVSFKHSATFSNARIIFHSKK